MKLQDYLKPEVQEKLKGQPASFTDIAFDTGVIAERTRTLNIINDLLETAKAYEVSLLARLAERVEAND
jgi:hypothetical protein